jgi:hypothetical protein
MVVHERAGEGETSRVEIHSDYAALRPDSVAEEIDDSEWPTAKIQRALTRSNVNPI